MNQDSPEQFVEIEISDPRKRLDVPGPYSNRHERRVWMAKKRQEARQEAKHAAERAAKRDDKRALQESKRDEK